MIKRVITAVAMTALLVALRAGGADDAAPTATLTIRITDVRNHKGDLIFGVFKTADGFPSEKGKSVNWQVKPASGDTVVFTAKLPAGKYGASVLHDENRNGQIDRGSFGVPLEGYGVTNNPKPALRGATFEEALFTLPKEGKELTISVQYFR
jgi:uncharacterized protein (DUF2141 family)